MSYEAWAIIPNQIDYRLLTIDRWLLNSLNFKPLNKKAVSFEQLFPAQFTIDYRLSTVDYWLLNFKPLNKKALRNEPLTWCLIHNYYCPLNHNSPIATPWM